MDPEHALPDPDDEDEDDDDDSEGPLPQFYLTTFIPRPAWYEQDRDEAAEFLRNRIAQLNEAFVDDEGVIWAYNYHVLETGGRQVDAVVLLWLVTSPEALESLELTLRRSDVNRYFDWSVIGGPQNNGPEDLLGAFLATLDPPDGSGPVGPGVDPTHADGVEHED